MKHAREQSAPPFHEGELAVQARVGERELADHNGVILQGTIAPRMAPFLTEQALLVVGSLDDQQQPWASVVFGAPGFARALSGGREVELALDEVARSPGDVLWTNLLAGRELALLAIDLDRRRRLRINGVLTGVDGRHARLAVREAYPNCPKYIRRRRLIGLAPPPQPPPAIEAGEALDAPRLQLIAASDLFFVASRHPQRGLDVSHRGGPPGFVRALDERVLRIPDYPGNGMYNTLGNLTVDPRAGVVFLDFARDSGLQLIGTARVVFDDVERGQPTGGTARFWEFAVTRWRQISLGVASRWEALEPSPFTPTAEDENGL